MPEGTAGSSDAKTQKKAEKLTADQVAVRQLVTVIPEPRTAQELADRYDGLRTENMWPQQSKKSVRERIEELLGLGLLKEGETAPDGEPTIELVAD